MAEILIVSLDVFHSIFLSNADKNNLKFDSMLFSVNLHKSTDGLSNPGTVRQTQHKKWIKIKLVEILTGKQVLILCNV